LADPFPQVNVRPHYNGIQISPPDERLIVVRTDQEQASEHHRVLDEPLMARLRPFTVTIRTKGGEAIHAIEVVFTIVDANGVTHDMPMFYDGPNDGKFAVVFAGSSTSFWPGGRVTKTPPPYRSQNSQPLISMPNETTLAMIEHAQSVTVSVPFVEFADGTIYDEGGWAVKVAATRQRIR
jgi:hypothetical protein